MGLTTHDSNAFNSITETVPESAEADCVGKYICCFNEWLTLDFVCLYFVLQIIHQFFFTSFQKVLMMRIPSTNLVIFFYNNWTIYIAFIYHRPVC